MWPVHPSEVQWLDSIASGTVTPDLFTRREHRRRHKQGVYGSKKT